MKRMLYCFTYTWQEDLYYPHHWIQDLIWDTAYLFTEPLLTRWPFNKIREKALEVAIKGIHYEDQNTRYIHGGCINKVFIIISKHIYYLYYAPIEIFSFGDFMFLFRSLDLCLLVGYTIHLEMPLRSILQGSQIIYGFQKMECVYRYINTS